MWSASYQRVCVGCGSVLATADVAVAFVAAASAAAAAAAVADPLSLFGPGTEPHTWWNLDNVSAECFYRMWSASYQRVCVGCGYVVAVAAVAVAAAASAAAAVPDADPLDRTRRRAAYAVGPG